MTFYNANIFRAYVFEGLYISECFSQSSLYYHCVIRLYAQRDSSEARVVSMAFPKSYAVLVLTLFLGSLHVVLATNYAMFDSGANGDFKMHWTFDGNKLKFNITCKATGWCAVAFSTTNDGKGMRNYDIAAGGVDNNGAAYLAVSLSLYLFCTFL